MTRRISIILAALALFFGLTMAPVLAATGPFTLDSNTWCPSYKELNGCTSTQSPSQYTVSFAASQVSVGSSSVSLNMNSAAGLSGATNDYSYSNQYISNDEEVWEDVNVPCNSAGLVENWPAFWLNGTTGTWPEHGEIDIAEGLAGHMYWHYHYVNSAGDDAQYGGEYTGNVCGAHSYTVYRTPDKLTFYDGSTVAGTVTPADIGGVALATDPMYVINDYGAGTDGGPTTNGTSMVIKGYGTYTP